MGVIPKPNLSSSEGINSCCHRFDVLLSRRIDSICHYDRSWHRFELSLVIDEPSAALLILPAYAFAETCFCDIAENAGNAGSNYVIVI